MLTLSQYSFKKKALSTTLNRTKYFKFRVKSKVLNHTYAQEVRKKFIKRVRKYLTKTKSSQIQSLLRLMYKRTTNPKCSSLRSKLMRTYSSNSNPYSRLSTQVGKY